MSYQLTFPDNSVHLFSEPLSSFEIIERTLPFLKKKAVCARYNGALIDLQIPIYESGSFEVLTLQHSNEVLLVLRRSFAFLLASVLESAFPTACLSQVALTDDGLYCDFSMRENLTETDLVTLEQQIKETLKKGFSLVSSNESELRSFWLPDPSRVYRSSCLTNASDESVFFYRAGHFIDFSECPVVYDGRFLSSFALLSVSGAYWQGDATQPMHQRIYVTLWSTPQELSAYLEQRKERERRDHRLLGKRLDFFHIQDEAPGMIFWHDKGYRLWRLVENYIRDCLVLSGYQEVKTPQLVDRRLWEASGHWENYGQHMFSTESEKRNYAIKPMNCPCHVQIFNASLRSYRDLPLRMAEFGTCHRNEPSGALHGLMRVRSFVQDDAHIFCTPAQILDEVIAFNELLKKVYADFGFREIDVKLSLRPDKSIGTDQMWVRAESALRQALLDSALSFEEMPGEGAFYGPKIEFHIKDAIGRSWQCGTLQLDFALPERLEAFFVDEDNQRHTPVMLHRAILGSIERFIGILIEHYAGLLPLWLSPVQVAILSISEKSAVYCQKVEAFLSSHAIRCVSDLRSEKIGYKIREHTVSCVPYLLVVGEQEVATHTVMVRKRNGDTVGQLSFDDCAAFLVDEVAQKI